MINNTSKRAVKGYRGVKIVQIPATAGIYTWYFAPNLRTKEAMENVGSIFANILNAPPSHKTVVGYRYGINWESSGDLILKKVRSSAARDEELFEKIAGGSETLRKFLGTQLVPYFSRPLYIGISKNVHDRVYKAHYRLLDEYWDSSSSVTKYLENHDGASVSAVMEALSLKHSFSLEARVRGIHIDQLLVYVQPFSSNSYSPDDEQELSELETVLQWLADPVCGRA